MQVDGAAGNRRNARRTEQSNGGPSDRALQHSEGRARGAWPTVWRRLGVASMLVAAGLVTWLAMRLAKSVPYAEVRQAWRAISATQLGLSCLLAGASYVLQTVYDRVALRQLGHKDLPRGLVMRAAFAGQAVANCVGVGPLSGGALRFRFYGAMGVGLGDVARTVLLTTAAIFSGAALLAGTSMLLDSTAVADAMSTPPTLVRIVGAALVMAVAALFAAAALRRGRTTIWRWTIELPTPGLLLRLTAVSVADWLLAAACAYVLLPPGLNFVRFAAIYMAAQVAGILSRVPAGLGVFEAVCLAALAPVSGHGPVLAALALYRVIYYLLPLGLAVALLVERERPAVLAQLPAPIRSLGRAAGALVPSGTALIVAASGVVLLVSGATPARPTRVAMLEPVVPSALLESSHLVASVAGAGLLVMARGLYRRIDSARLVSMLLLATGVVASLLKGLDWEEALLLALTLAVLWATRGEFNRAGALLGAPFTGRWIAGLVSLILGLAALTYLLHRTVISLDTVWWQFAVRGEVPRAIRGAVGAAAVFVLFGLSSLVASPPRVRPQPPNAALLDAVAPIVLAAPATDGYLAFVGDKALMRSSSGRSFMMYSVRGRSWIGLGDPVGDPAERRELLWMLRDAADSHGGRLGLYELTGETMLLALEVGLGAVKIGEEARVPLETFSISGKARKTLRGDYNHATRGGYTVELVERSRAEQLLPRLREISDAWLAHKHTRERGFSMGFFDEAYLRRCGLAVVKRSDAIVAFANVWLGGAHEELSVDLMRYVPGVDRGVMELLFIELMLWGRAQGYRWFNLGMAPLSGISARHGSPLWDHLTTAVFRYGEHFYNFRGVRSFKEKFEPAWRPRYLAYEGALDLPWLLADVAALCARGIKGVFGR
jgi:phosphatidylglycerol lysyltransferase